MRRCYAMSVEVQEQSSLVDLLRLFEAKFDTKVVHY